MGKNKLNNWEKPLISHQLSQKLKTHSLYSGENKTIAVDLDSEEEGNEKDHSEYLDDSLHKMELSKSNIVTNSINSEDTALVSAMKNIQPLTENKAYLNSSEIHNMWHNGSENTK